MNTITIELCTEDRARLDAIIEGLAKQTPNCQSCVEHVMAGVNGIAAKVAVPADPEPEEQPQMADPEAVEPSQEEEPVVTLTDIRQKVTQLRASKDPKKKDGAKAIVNEYAENISGLPADKLPEVMAKLLALESEV